MQLLPLEKTKFLDSAGVPYAGAKLYIYLTGTNTPIQSYGDSLGKLVYSNPITLDALGQTNVFVSPNYEYRLVLKDKLDRVILFKGEGFTGGTAKDAATAAPPPPPGPSSAENFVSASNPFLFTLLKGTPVFSNGIGVGVAIANSSTVKRLIGLVSANIPPGGSGLVQTGGIITMTNAEWELVTDMPGGIGNTNYRVDAVTAGKLTPFPLTLASPDVWSLVVGYGVNNTNFKIEIQPSIKL